MLLSVHPYLIQPTVNQYVNNRKHVCISFECKEFQKIQDLTT